jgi:hypothetical protein
LWTGELALESGELLNDVWGFKGPISSSDANLANHTCLDKAIDRLIGGLVAALGEVGGSFDRDDGSARQVFEDQINGRTFANLP